MGLEVVVLGIVSALRPATSQAAVFALLRAPAASRTLAAFTVAGFVCSAFAGFLLVAVFDGAGGAFGRRNFTDAFDVVAGVAALGFAAGVQRGGLNRKRDRPPGRAASAIATRLSRPTMATAAVAGVATHVPGLIYLVALNSIAAGKPGPAQAFAEVAIYNALWFALPLGALVLVLRSPATATAFLDRLTAWARRNEQRLIVGLFGLLGIYLTIRGVAGLAS